jgi:hypothetical protein
MVAMWLHLFLVTLEHLRVPANPRSPASPQQGKHRVRSALTSKQTIVSNRKLAEDEIATMNSPLSAFWGSV